MDRTRSNPILDPPEDPLAGKTRRAFVSKHPRVNPILDGHPWNERPHGKRTVGPPQRTNIFGESSPRKGRKAAGFGMTASQSTAYEVIRGCGDVLTPSPRSRMRNMTRVKMTRDPILGTGEHSEALPIRPLRIHERLHARW